jgi:hypothetical protein
MRTRVFPVVLAGMALSSLASAQTPGHPPFPRPIPFPGKAPQLSVDDCAISAMNVFVQARRSSAMVDVGLRVKGVKGGACRVMPAAAQIASGRGAAVARPISVRFVDGQVQRPFNMAEGAGGEMLGPWVGMLKAGEEKQLVLRFYVEGVDAGEGTVDPAARLLLQLRSLGPRVYDGAPLHVKLSLDPSTKGRVVLSTGNPKNAKPPQSTGADGTVQVSSTLSREDLLPQIEWRYDAEMPASSSADQLGSGLAVFEYLRSGLVQDLAGGLLGSEQPTGKKDEKKDEKKDDKARAEAAWDRAFDVSFAAMKSNDPVVAGMGLRAFAWLASGLGASAVRVHAPGGVGGPDSVEVPEKLAEPANKAGDAFKAATGQRVAPSLGHSVFAKGAIAKLGEPGSRKKEADEALKRLATRLEEGKLAATVGNFFSTAPAIALAAGVKVPGARLIAWNKQGIPQFVAMGRPATPRAPMVRRVVHTLSHAGSLAKFMAMLAVAAGLVVAAWWAFFRGRPVPSKQATA